MSVFLCTAMDRPPVIITVMIQIMIGIMVHIINLNIIFILIIIIADSFMDLMTLQHRLCNCLEGLSPRLVGAQQGKLQ